MVEPLIYRQLSDERLFDPLAERDAAQDDTVGIPVPPAPPPPRAGAPIQKAGQ